MSNTKPVKTRKPPPLNHSGRHQNKGTDVAHLTTWRYWARGLTRISSYLVAFWEETSIIYAVISNCSNYWTVMTKRLTEIILGLNHRKVDFSMKIIIRLSSAATANRVDIGTRIAPMRALGWIASSAARTRMTHLTAQRNCASNATGLGTEPPTVPPRKLHTVIVVKCLVTKQSDA